MRMVMRVVNVEMSVELLMLKKLAALALASRAAIAAKREAKAKAASFVATAMNDDDVPF